MACILTQSFKTAVHHYNYDQYVKAQMHSYYIQQQSNTMSKVQQKSCNHLFNNYKAYKS